MSDTPPVLGQNPWGADLNAYLATLDARCLTLEERVLALERTPTQYVDRYSFNTNTAPPPSSGQLRFNNSSQAATTALFLSYDNQDGTDTTNFWASLTTIVKIYVQDRDDSTKWVRFNSPQPHIDRGTYVEIPVTWDSDSGTPIPAQQVTLVITR